MTQAELALAAGTTGSVISLLESGDRGLSDKWLHKLAVPLKTRPGFILDVDPNTMDTDFLDLLLDTPDEHRPQITNVIRVMFPKKPSKGSDDAEDGGKNQNNNGI